MALRKIIYFEKFADELVAHSVDFVDELGGGESISSQSVVARDIAGNVVTTSIIEQSSPAPAINGTAIEYTLQAGNSVGREYWIDVEATLNTGRKPVQRLHMSVPAP